MPGPPLIFGIITGMTSCSIIVPTYNRLMQLRACLEALAALDYPTFEVIVVDDCSTDGTAEYLNGLNDPRFRFTSLPQNSGASEARNRGLALARYPLLAFTDDDCVVDNRWLSELMPAFDNEHIGFAIGATINVAPGYRGYFPERIIHNQDGQFPGGGNIAYRREVFERIGGFDDVFFRAYHNEDSELAVRAAAAGYDYVSRPRALAYHQKSTWTPRTLLASAKNAAVWPVMKRRYPTHYCVFKPPVAWNAMVAPQEYLYLLLTPILIPLLLVRYLMHGKRDLKIFFCKWPLWLILKRFYIWREALRQGVLML